MLINFTVGVVRFILLKTLLRLLFRLASETAPSVVCGTVSSILHEGVESGELGDLAMEIGNCIQGLHFIKTDYKSNAVCLQNWTAKW